MLANMRKSVVNVAVQGRKRQEKKQRQWQEFRRFCSLKGNDKERTAKSNKEDIKEQIQQMGI